MQNWTIKAERGASKRGCSPDDCIIWTALRKCEGWTDDTEEQHISETSGFTVLQTISDYNNN